MKRRSVEPVPAWVSCKWLLRCASADALHDHWQALGLWSPALCAALHLPKFGRRYPCEGCPIMASREAA